MDFLENNEIDEHLGVQSIETSSALPVYANGSALMTVALKEKITNFLQGITHQKVMSLLSASLDVEKMSKEVFKIIKKEATYIATIPMHLKEDMRCGLLDFMVDSKTGENFGVFVNEKHKTKGYMHIEKVMTKADFTSSLESIAMQQQLAQITDMIGDVRNRIIALQEGHDADLYGSIKGMHQQLLQMRDAHNSETRRQLATNSVTVLNDVRGSIEITLLNTLRAIDSVPDKDSKIMMRIAKNKNFLSDTVEKYDRIEELFSYYLTASQMLGYVYAFLDEPASFDVIFTPSKDLIENKNLHKLIAAESLYEEAIGVTWYKNPDMFLAGIKNELNRILSDNNDVVTIEFSGAELLEVLEYGKKQNEENSQNEISDG
jgi:hypothetical protein